MNQQLSQKQLPTNHVHLRYLGQQPLSSNISNQNPNINPNININQSNNLQSNIVRSNSYNYSNINNYNNSQYSSHNNNIGNNSNGNYMNVSGQDGIGFSGRIGSIKKNKNNNVNNINNNNNNNDNTNINSNTNININANTNTNSITTSNIRNNIITNKLPTKQQYNTNTINTNNTNTNNNIDKYNQFQLLNRPINNPHTSHNSLNKNTHNNNQNSNSNTNSNNKLDKIVKKIHNNNNNNQQQQQQQYNSPLRPKQSTYKPIHQASLYNSSNNNNNNNTAKKKQVQQQQQQQQLQLNKYFNNQSDNENQIDNLQADGEEQFILGEEMLQFNMLNCEKNAGESSNSRKNIIDSNSSLNKKQNNNINTNTNTKNTNNMKNKNNIISSQNQHKNAIFDNEHKNILIGDISSLHDYHDYGKQQQSGSKQFKASSNFNYNLDPQANSVNNNNLNNVKTNPSKSFKNSKEQLLNPIIKKQQPKSQQQEKQQQQFSKNSNPHNPHNNYNSKEKFIKALASMQANSHPSSFIDSRHELNQHNSSTKYGPGGIQTLEFNPQNQKFIILDSKQTEGLFNNNCNIKEFCQNFEAPVLDQLPTPEKSPQQLVTIAKKQFLKNGYPITDQTVINVKKYKNCIHFNIDNQNNILYHFQTGKVYIGCWKMLNSLQGEKHGEGIEVLPGKYKFKGLFCEGKKSGYGILIGFDGTAYAGNWENGVRHGIGKQLDADGIVYEGQWKQGKKNGYGKLFNNGRLQFQGVFIKGLKNGYGKQFFQNGDIYDGNYINHKFQGQGTYYWKSGATYIGQFRAGRRNGYGIWKSSGNNYDTYQGQYIDDKKQGKGVYTWANGSRYEGQFKQDLKHGVGTITYQNGKVAHLNWIKGKAQKKVDQKQVEQYKSNFAQLTERKSHLNNSKANQIFHSKSKNNFILRNKTAARSTQNINSARSSSTNNSQGLGLTKGINFNTRSATKLFKFQQQAQQPGQQTKQFQNHQTQPKKGQQIIRLKFDNKQFEKAIGKNWNKNLASLKGNKQGFAGNMLGGGEFQSSRPDYPKDRPYQGIQLSSNFNMQF